MGGFWVVIGGRGRGNREGGRDVLHALGRTSPVAVVKVKFFALEDECADAVL